MPPAAWSDRLDAATLDRVRQTMGGQAGLEELLREFLTCSAALLTEIGTPPRFPDRRVERAAHTLKSMARLLGAESLAEACRRLEFAAHGPRTDWVPQNLVEDVHTRAAQVQEAVRRLIA